MSGIKASQIAGYVILPGILPRLRGLFASGFGYAAFLTAYIYGMIRLLPLNHPYLDAANIGRFGVIQVLAAAAGHLKFDRKHADQIFIYIVTLAGFVLLGLQIISLFYGYLIRPAAAISIFDTPQPEYDVAFLLLDQVFGVPDLFCSFGGTCTSIASTLPTPFHTALHGLFQFYSLGILVVGVLIFLYFVIVVVGETATSGTPFGQRFQNIWVPVRIVMALGLLLPLNYGLNSSQYIVLYAAKYGSGFANSAWSRFNTAIRESPSGQQTFPGGAGANPSGERETLLARPRAPDVSPLVQYMALVHACAYAHTKLEPIGAPIGSNYNSAMGAGIIPPGSTASIQPYLAKRSYFWMENQQEVLWLQPSTSYEDALKFYNFKNLVISFGIYDPSNEDYKAYPGQVKSVCGEIIVPVNSVDRYEEADSIGGPQMMQKYYFEMMKEMWYGGGFQVPLLQHSIIDLSHRFMEVVLHSENNLQCQIACDNTFLPSCQGGGAGTDPPCNTDMPAALAKQELIDRYNQNLQNRVYLAWDLYRTEAITSGITEDMLARGWGGAGIWYNTISEINGMFIDGVVHVPGVAKYPLVMEQVRDKRRENDSNLSAEDQYRPTLANGEDVEIESGAVGLEIAKKLSEYNDYWGRDQANQGNDKQISGNIFYDAINLLLGTSGLMEMRGDNAQMHPLAQLSLLGKGMVDTAVRNIMISTGLAFMGGPVAVLAPQIGPFLQGASGLLQSVTFIFLTGGVILFYILPFLPFMYFFFSVASWVKSIFEAMVGAPLWALGHLRIDGEGLPGDAASGGYFLVLEIFLRPILTLFGMIAAMVIFTAGARVLNFIWDLVIVNIGGFEPDPSVSILFFSIPRGPVDTFFHMILYAVIIYMMAMACFKLIDRIPDGILRWMGAGVKSFGDSDNQGAEQLIQLVAFSGITVGKQMTGAVTKLGGDAGNIVANEMRRMSGSPTPPTPPPGTKP